MRTPLSLRREALADLTPADLAVVFGGGAGTEGCPPSATCPSATCGSDTCGCGPTTAVVIDRTLLCLTQTG